MLALILALLLARYALDTLADFLNLRSLSTQVPPEFEGIYDPERYRKTLEYQRENHRFGLFSSSLSLLATLAFILAGGFDSVDGFARSFGLGEIATGLVFVGALSALKGALQLPFSVYDTFVIEARYGFNRTTPRVFVQDLVKGAVLGILIGSPIFAGILWFFESAGERAWLYAWAAVTTLQILLTFLAPVVIMPLFNRFSPLPEGDLKSTIEAFARKQGFQLSGIFTMDGSKRSTKANAFFTGFGKFKRLVLFDTLIEKHSTEELVAVLAHEIGHYQRRHILKFAALSIATTAAIFWFVSMILNNPSLFEAFGMQRMSVYAGLIFAGFLYSPALRLLSILTNGLSRKFEFEADAYARETFGKPEALVSALKKLSHDTMSNLTPHPLKVILDYSHPPVTKRIEALRAR